MNADPGVLEIELAYDAGRLSAVRVDGVRPNVARALIGHTPKTALVLVDHLFSICGRAQHAAAALALGAATGAPESEARAISLARSVAHEAVQEHLWRLLLDWPRQVGVEPDVASFRYWYRAADPARGELSVSELRAALERDWLGVPLHELSDFDVRATREWVSGEHRPIAQVLNVLLDHGNSGRRPGIAPRESGAIDRVQRSPWIASLLEHAPLAARVAARVIDLGRLLDAIEHDGDLRSACHFSVERVGENRGESQTIVARGLLRHEVELDGDRICHYALTTPTDGNFSLDGAYPWHVQRESPRDLEAALKLGQLWALALDPCVQYRVFMGSGHA